MTVAEQSLDRLVRWIGLAIGDAICAEEARLEVCIRTCGGERAPLNGA